MPEHFDQAAAPATEDEQMPIVRIAPERLLHHQRQTIKTFAHVGMACRQPHSRSARDRDHRRPLPFTSAFISADTVGTSTAPVIRIRPPLANSISMTPGGSGGDAGETAPTSGATRTGLNAVGVAARSHSSCRQRNNWLL